jgi:hypothetical protein
MKAYDQALARPRFDPEFQALVDRHYSERTISIALLSGAGAFAVGALLASLLN